MIDAENQDELKYEQINQKIKGNIKNSFISFNEPEKEMHYIPLNNKEIKNEIEKEYESILNSLKNEIILDINDIQNDLKSFKLSGYKIKDIKSDKLKINKSIDTLVNKINNLKYENELTNILLSNITKGKNLKNIDLISKKNLFIKNYDKNEQFLTSININCKEIQKYLEELKNKNYQYSLNKLRKRFESFTKEMNNITFLKNQEIYNNSEKKSLSDDIEKVKALLDFIKKNTYSIKKEENIIQEILNIKNNIKLNKNIISELHNTIEQTDKKNLLLEEKISNNIDKLNDLKNNVLNPIQIETKQNVEKIDNLKDSLIKRSDLEEIKNNIFPLNEDIAKLNLKEKNNEYQSEKLNESIDKLKKDIFNFTKKIEYYNYMNNVNEKMNNIKNDLNEKVNIVENNLNNIITNLIEKQNDNLNNNVGNEINKINQEEGNINNVLNKNKNTINSNKQNIELIQNKFIEIDENILKINNINNNMIREKQDLKDLENKLLEIEKRIKNEPIENIEYRSSLMKSINNCIYENNRSMNEIIKKGLLNREKKTNLFINLNDIEKNIINNKKFLEDLIDNFIETQNKINTRNKEDINLIKGKISQNDYNVLEKLNNIENEIDLISGKYNDLIDRFQQNYQRIQNNQKELIEFQRKTEKEIEDVKLSLDEKINDYSYNSEYNLSQSNIYT